MTIEKASIEGASRIAAVICASHKDVAEEFGINRANNPRHPSFYTEDWVMSDFDRGEEYFLYEEAGVAQGCVAFAHLQPNVAYLNRLSVLPEYRHQGIGTSLVRHIAECAGVKNIAVISIGIIAHHHKLKAWYSGLGFIAVETKTFSHLPFDVTYMHLQVS